jgi:hypothetical protein
MCCPFIFCKGKKKEHVPSIDKRKGKEKAEEPRKEAKVVEEEDREE